MTLSCIVREIQWVICRQSRYFYISPVFNLTIRRGWPRRNLAKLFAIHKIRMIGRNCYDMLSRFDSIPECDRQTEFLNQYVQLYIKSKYNKKLSCRRKTVRCFVSNISLSHSKRHLSRACVSLYWYFIVTRPTYLVPFMRYLASNNGVTLKSGYSTSLKMVVLPFESLGTVSYLHSTVTVARAYLVFPRWSEILVETHDFFVLPAFDAPARNIAITFDSLWKY